jgi:hypothetical protein
MTTIVKTVSPTAKKTHPKFGSRQLVIVRTKTAAKIAKAIKIAIIVRGDLLHSHL